MIRVEKPDNAPAILRNRGRTTTETMCRDYDNGTRKFEFKSSIYGARSVKNALRKAQHDKCAFCESKLTHVAYGDVEHFRPKAAFRQVKGDALQRPGYYWLAYEWQNLLFACQICNQRFKENLFPLRDPRTRARSHHDDVGEENPLILHPAETDPTNHIGFREEVCFPIDDSDLGKATIELLGLNRPEMIERRRDYLHDTLESHRELVRVLATLIEHYENHGEEVPAELVDQLNQHMSRIDEFQEASSEYASMAHAFFAGPD